MTTMDGIVARITIRTPYSGYLCSWYNITVFMSEELLISITGYGCEPSMCVAVPAEVLEIKDGNIGVVDYGDLKQEVRLDLVDVKVGEYVLVHVGFCDPASFPRGRS